MSAKSCPEGYHYRKSYTRKIRKSIANTGFLVRRKGQFYTAHPNTSPVYVPGTCVKKPASPRKTKIGKLRKGDLIKCETEYFDYKLHIILVDAILHQYVGNDYSNLYEFGCGPAYHLLRFGNFNTDINLIGLDWAIASQNIIKEINELGINNKITGHNFDYFNPDYSIDIASNSAIFTCASLEQIGENYKEFVDYILAKQPDLCIHFEPEARILDENNLVDKLSILYFNKRKYLKGYLSYLESLQDEGKIEIKTQRLYGGSYFIEGYPAIIWKIKK